MGQLAEAIRGVALPTQKQAQLLRLDVQFEEMETQIEFFKLATAKCEERNKKLLEKIKPLEEKIERLEAQLKARASSKEKNVVHEELDSVEEELLRYIAHV